MNHVPSDALWTFSCRATALNALQLQHLLTCVECERLLDQIEETLDDIAAEQCRPRQAGGLWLRPVTVSKNA